MGFHPSCDVRGHWLETSCTFCYSLASGSVWLKDVSESISPMIPIRACAHVRQCKKDRIIREHGRVSEDLISVSLTLYRMAILIV